jgi:hypothetical protein
MNATQSSKTTQEQQQQNGDRIHVSALTDIPPFLIRVGYFLFLFQARWMHKLPPQRSLTKGLKKGLFPLD